MSLKIAFFNSVASEPFLCRFETSAPMVTFLYAEVFNIIYWGLMMHLIKKYVMAEAKNAKQLSQIDVSSEKVRLESSDADIVVATDSFFGQKPVAQL